MTQQEFTQRYEFDIKTDKIGGGSFGTVYRAYDNALDREVAIKISEVKMVGDKEFSLLEEFKAIENIPVNKFIANYEEVFRYESFNGIYDYGIMQYYPLGNLSSYLKENKVTIEKREDLVIGILSGISFLHKYKVVHRDLKPSNILVVDRRGELIPKITDFGLSKQAEADGKASRFTNSFAGGTLQYSSPEQLKGLPLKLNTDLWSFGAIAYEILTGRTLFEADSKGTATAEWQNEITQKILHKDVSAQLKEISEKWQRVISTCLERDLSKRIKTSDDLFVILNNKNVETKEATSPKINEDATIIKNKEAPKVTSFIKNDPQKKEIPKKENVQKTQPVAKQEQPKWIIPTIAVAVILIALVSYFSFFKTEKIKPINTHFQIYEKDGLFGYKVGDEIVIPAKYSLARSFVNGIANVETKDSSFFIDKKGAWVHMEVLDSTSVSKNVEKTTKKETKKASQTIKKKEVIQPVKKETQKKETNKIIINAELIPKAELSSWIKKGNNLQNTIDAANAGNPVAQRRWARINGYVYKNEEKAFYWNKKAALNGDAKAQGNLGVAYHNGNSVVKQDYKEAFNWYNKAIKNGNNYSIMNLGVMYQFGLYVKKDESKAYELYKLSAEKGEKAAQIRVADAYYSGNGLSKDYAKSFTWYLKAAKQNDVQSQYTIAFMYDYGQGTTINWREAVKWYKKAANQGHTVSKRKVGEFYFFGVGGVSKNTTKAKQLFREAANKGDKKAKSYFNVIDDYNNEKTYLIAASKYGNTIKASSATINELAKGDQPVIMSKYSNSWTYGFDYTLGQSSSVQIWPAASAFNKERYDDEVDYSSYSSSNRYTNNGTKKVSVGFKDGGGYRGIGYMYVRAGFNSPDEVLEVKIPMLVCWKPKNEY